MSTLGLLPFQPISLARLLDASVEAFDTGFRYVAHVVYYYYLDANWFFYSPVTRRSCTRNTFTSSVIHMTHFLPSKRPLNGSHAVRQARYGTKQVGAVNMGENGYCAGNSLELSVMTKSE